MADEQLDLFHAAPTSPTQLALPQADRPAIDPAALSDDELVEGVADLRMADCLARIQEIGRRRLTTGISALEQLCRKHVGFGRSRIIPEQAAALEALMAIGGREAAAAVGRLVARRAIEGPGLTLALRVAARLVAPLEDDILGEHLRSDDPAIRAAAAGCVRTWRRLAPTLIELLDDLHGEVRIAAACALGRMGRREGRAVVMRVLQQDPTAEVMAACAGIGDSDTIVLLRRIAASRPELSAAAQEAIEGIESR